MDFGGAIGDQTMVRAAYDGPSTAKMLRMPTMKDRLEKAVNAAEARLAVLVPDGQYFRRVR